MPTKPKSAFECIECGTEYLRWQGQCDQCSEWNTLEPITIIVKNDIIESSSKVSRLVDVQEPKTSRLYSGFKELDRVLGSGWVHGSVNLICGEPGIGKSTLVLQSCIESAKSNPKTLYLTAEDSEIQVKDRAKRLVDKIPDNMFISAITDMESIITIIQKEKPDVVILDSIQMVMSQN